MWRQLSGGDFDLQRHDSLQILVWEGAAEHWEVVVGLTTACGHSCGQPTKGHPVLTTYPSNSQHCTREMTWHCPLLWLCTNLWERNVHFRIVLLFKVFYKTGIDKDSYWTLEGKCICWVFYTSSLPNLFISTSLLQPPWKKTNLNCPQRPVSIIKVSSKPSSDSHTSVLCHETFWSFISYRLFLVPNVTHRNIC